LCRGRIDESHGARAPPHLRKPRLLHWGAHHRPPCCVRARPELFSSIECTTWVHLMSTALRRKSRCVCSAVLAHAALAALGLRAPGPLRADAPRPRHACLGRHPSQLLFACASGSDDADSDKPHGNDGRRARAPRHQFARAPRHARRLVRVHSEPWRRRMESARASCYVHRAARRARVACAWAPTGGASARRAGAHRYIVCTACTHTSALLCVSSLVSPCRCVHHKITHCVTHCVTRIC
jgi:hypothetical protein